MPIYEYVCPNCQNVFEQWLKVSETTERAVCPKCGHQARHIISNTAFVLKGGGWYVTDYGYRKGVSDSGQTAVNTAGASSISSTTDGSEQGESAAPAAVTPSQQASGATEGASA